MLKKDKKKLKAVLKLLYYSASSFNVRKNGTIVIKKNIWSTKKSKISVTELIENKLPRIMAAISLPAAEDFTLAIHDLKPYNESDALTLAFEHFATFRQNERFLGVCLESDLGKSLPSRIKEAVNKYVDRKKSAIAAWKFEFSLRDYISKKQNSIKVEAVKALPSANVSSLKDILSIESREYIKTVGKCFLNKPEYDEKFKRVERMISYQFA